MTDPVADFIRASARPAPGRAPRRMRPGSGTRRGAAARRAASEHEDRGMDCPPRRRGRLLVSFVSYRSGGHSCCGLWALSIWLTWGACAPNRPRSLEKELWNEDEACRPHARSRHLSRARGAPAPRVQQADERRTLTSPRPTADLAMGTSHRNSRAAFLRGEGARIARTLERNWRSRKYATSPAAGNSRRAHRGFALHSRRSALHGRIFRAAAAALSDSGGGGGDEASQQDFSLVITGCGAPSGSTAISDISASTFAPARDAGPLCKPPLRCLPRPKR